jgi:hypothetical protein
MVALHFILRVKYSVNIKSPVTLTGSPEFTQISTMLIPWDTSEI